MLRFTRNILAMTAGVRKIRVPVFAAPADLTTPLDNFRALAAALQPDSRRIRAIGAGVSDLAGKGSAR